MSTKDLTQQSTELSIKEIVEHLLDGKKITMPFYSARELQKFFSNLNVEKSRKKLANEMYGFDFENKIIVCDPRHAPVHTEQLDKLLQNEFTFYCIDPKPPKKYSVFKIID